MSLHASSGPVYHQQMTFDTVYYASLDGTFKCQIPRRKYNAMGEPSVLHIEYRLQNVADSKAGTEFS